jgi:hypothetical protein
MRIGAVCKTWRHAVMATQRAWINIHGLLGVKLTEIYIIRSGTSLLNVSLPKCSRRDISSISGRIRQLTAFSLPLGTLTFPNLEHLEILIDPHTDPDYQNSWHGITCSNFSSLSHLEIRSQGAFLDHFPLFKPSEFPPLSSLHLSFNPAYLTWLVMLRWFASSLKSLFVHCNPPYRKEQYSPNVACKAHYQVQFPLLLSLNLSMASTMPLQLKTPSLRVYCDSAPGRNEIDSLGHNDLGSVNCMRVDTIPSLPHMDQLRILQVLIPFHTHPTLLHQLLLDDASCPHLEVVEFHGPCESDEVLSERRRALEEWVKRNNPLRNVKLLVVSGAWQQQVYNSAIATSRVSRQ